MTDRRCSLLWTVVTLTLLAALPAAAAPASPTSAAADLEASYAAIFAAPPADPAATTDAGFTISVCCSATYCCELMPPSECDGAAFGSVYTCAMRCSYC